MSRSDQMLYYLPILKKISKLSDKHKRQYVKNCERGLLECFSERANNILKNNIRLTPNQFDVLRRQRTDLLALASKRTSLRQKRKIVQKGGFLSALLIPALSTLASVLLNHAIR